LGGGGFGNKEPKKGKTRSEIRRKEGDRQGRKEFFMSKVTQPKRGYPRHKRTRSSIVCKKLGVKG